MADNVPLRTGLTIASEDDGNGAQVQITKDKEVLRAVQELQVLLSSLTSNGRLLTASGDDESGGGSVGGGAASGPVASVVTIILSTESPTPILQANAARRGATIYNDSTQPLVLLLGTGVTSTLFTTKLEPSSYYELPFGWAGVVEGFWPVAAGSARVTEVS